MKIDILPIFYKNAKGPRYNSIRSYLHLTLSSFVILLVAVANTYACKGLDRIEEKLPILNQPTNQVSLVGQECQGLLPHTSSCSVWLAQAVHVMNMP